MAEAGPSPVVFSTDAAAPSESVLDAERKNHQRRLASNQPLLQHLWLLACKCPPLVTAGLLWAHILWQMRLHVLVRAERFGVDYVEPGKRKDLRLQFRKERNKREGFKTGLDLFDEVCLPCHPPYANPCIVCASCSGMPSEACWRCCLHASCRIAFFIFLPTPKLLSTGH